MSIDTTLWIRHSLRNQIEEVEEDIEFLTSALEDKTKEFNRLKETLNNIYYLLED